MVPHALDGYVVLFILWLLGFSLHVGGGLIHLLLVIAVVVLVYNLSDRPSLERGIATGSTEAGRASRLSLAHLRP
jgi:Family of unknown function (DUF5670)